MEHLSAIYDALTDEEAFSALPEELANIVGARSGLFQVFSSEGALADIRWNYFSREMFEFYVSNEFYRHDVWQQPASRPRAINKMHLMDEIIPLDRVLGSELYNDFYRVFGDDTAHCLGGVFNFAGGSASLGFHRGMRAQPFDSIDLSKIQPLIPHLRRLFELRQRLLTADQQGKLSEAALDAHSDAIFVTDPEGRPFLMNRAARELIRTDDGLRLSPKGLWAPSDAGANLLAAAISAAIAGSGALGGAFSLPRAHGPPLRVVVSPWQVGGRTRALVMVNDPAKHDGLLAAKLQAIYGLSQAESDTCVLLLMGLAPAQVAQSRQVSLATVRTQIRGALRKTEARGLLDLMALMASIPRLG